MSKDIWIGCDEYKACACGGAIKPGRHTPTECEPLDTLGRSGQVYVTLRAAREYAAGTELGDEEARRELTELLLDAKPQPKRGTYERWRYRSRARDLDVSALVSREGRLAVVVTVSVHGRSHGTTDEET